MLARFYHSSALIDTTLTLKILFRPWRYYSEPGSIGCCCTWFFFLHDGKNVTALWSLSWHTHNLLLCEQKEKSIIGEQVVHEPRYWSSWKRFDWHADYAKLVWALNQHCMSFNIHCKVYQNLSPTTARGLEKPTMGIGPSSTLTRACAQMLSTSMHHHSYRLKKTKDHMAYDLWTKVNSDIYRDRSACKQAKQTGVEIEGKQARGILRRGLSRQLCIQPDINAWNETKLLLSSCTSISTEKKRINRTIKST